jgi:tubulin polyglutamylase TTLL6/13
MKIEEIIIKTLCAVQPSVSHIYKTCQPEDLTNGMCFELLGFDIIIDSNLVPYLLEVNHSPSFSTDSPLDWKIKHKVIQDTLILLGSRVRDRKSYHQAKKDPPKKSSSIKQKETKEEKAEKQKEILERTEKWQEKHLAGFSKIFPAPGTERFETFINAANNMWYEISRHLPRAKKEENNKNVVSKVQVKKKTQTSAPRRNLTLSSTSLQKLAHLIPAGEGREDGDVDEGNMQKYLKIFRANPGFMDLKEMVYYKHLEDILKDRRQAASFMRAHDTSFKIPKPPKQIRMKEGSQGNYVTPKTFTFSPKVLQRNSESKK